MIYASSTLFPFSSAEPPLLLVLVNIFSGVVTTVLVVGAMAAASEGVVFAVVGATTAVNAATF